MIAIKVETH